MEIKELKYAYSLEEGELRVMRLEALRKDQVRFACFVVLNLLLIGVPYLLSRW